MTLRFQSATVETRPLTRSQQLIWTGQRLQPNEPLYNMAMAFTLHGTIDRKSFQRAFQHVVNASQAMRTSFEHHDGVARQRFHEQFLYDVDWIDLTQKTNAQESAASLLKSRTQNLFDLERCLFDCALVKLSDDQFIWYFNQHHLVTDASSTALIYQAVAAEYHKIHGQLDTESQSFPDFGHYVDYEQDRQSSTSVKRAQCYWQELPERLVESGGFYSELPIERSGVTLRTPCELGPERIERVRQLALSETCRALTPDLAQFQVFATALFAWMHRTTGNRTLAFSMPMHNRALALHKQTPGLFIELYPLVVTIDDEESYSSLYRKVAAEVQRVMIHTGPGVSSFAINRNVHAVLNYITAEFGDFAGLPMSSEWIHPDSGDRNHLVRVQVENFDGFDQLRVFFDVNEQAFPPAVRHLPGEHFCVVLDAFSDDPEQPLAATRLLHDAEYRQVAAGVCTLDTPTDPITTVVHAFMEQLERQPLATAVRCGHHELSYQEFHARAVELAQALRAKHVGRTDRVAIALPRSISAVVASWATLMIGAAYVPVDLAYPAARREYLLENARVKLVVTDGAVLEAVPNGVPVLNVDVDSAALMDPPGAANSAPLMTAVAPDDSAYMIYTSGSTGQPKGVEISHRSLANYIGWARAYYQQEGALTWPLFSSMSFDLTVTSIYVPLCSGGTLVVYPEQSDHRDMAIRRVIEDNQVDIIKLTPAHLSLLQAMDLSTSRVRRLVVGGEDFRTELARSVYNYFGGRVELFNEYGPTEGTVACAVHRFNPTADDLVSVPIGQSVNGARLYVLNEHLEPQPRGVLGELYIGGVGVATGYFDNQALTLERFIDNPFVPGERMYRTGDLVRVRLNGQGEEAGLLCLGRADQQVKVNGLRVEPGEIEQALLQHADVSEAVVTLYTPDDDVAQSDEDYCERCGISSRHPSAQLDNNRVCQICHIYEAEAQRARDYFGDRHDLQKIVDDIHAASDSRPAGAPDCMMLLSGGKDSTYALCQVVDLGLKPLVFTLDNGFISQGAKDNIARVVDHLGLELISGSTPAMNAIFRDSLNRFSNVCNGCFKTIYTLSLKIAQERGIRHIFTGLSRGQIFETRVADLFRQGEFDIERIDSMIIEARKAYHRADDAVSQLMDVSHFDDDQIFNDIQYVDYYRYSDVSLDSMLDYLKNRVPWVRPADTGRSTNCLINEAGIFVHKQERGFHNYSLPYSWDVRLGHKERDAARDELDDNIDVDNVNRILSDIEYTPRNPAMDAKRRAVLVAYYVAGTELDSETLRNLLLSQLPDGMVPTHFVQLERLPLTPNGKIDRAALPSPAASRAHLDVVYEPPSGQIETLLVESWQHVFGMDRIGVNDNFFELGGDSIVNIQIVASVAKQGLLLSPQQVFDSPTIRTLAAVADTAVELSAEQGPVTGKVPLTPIQRRFFDWPLTHPHQYCQYVVLESRQTLDRYALQEALRQLMVHHDALRARFVAHDGTVQQQFVGPEELGTSWLDVDEEGNVTSQADIETRVQAIQRSFSLSEGELFRAVLLLGDPGGASKLVLVAHHLVVDAVSWWVLLDDLEDSYRALTQGQPVSLPPKTTSMRHWSQAHETFVDSHLARQELPGWQQAMHTLPELPAEQGTPEQGEPTQRRASCTLTLDAQETRRLLSNVPTNWRAQPQDVMVTALIETIASWSGVEALTVDMEAHGREAITDSVDVLRTVGWFTSVYPLCVEPGPASDGTDTLRTVRDRLRQIQLGGVSFGAQRYVQPDSATAKSLQGSVPIVFNYLGLWRKQRSSDALFKFHCPLAASFGDSERHPYAWALNAMVFDNQLSIVWDYDTSRFSDRTMTQLTSSLRQRLRELIDLCSSSVDERVSVQDFPNAGLAQDDLDDLLSEYGDL